MFIQYGKGVVEKVKRVSSKYGFTTVFTKNERLNKDNYEGQLRIKQEDEIETSGVVYEVVCNNCLKKCTGKTDIN